MTKECQTKKRSLMLDGSFVRFFCREKRLCIWNMAFVLIFMLCAPLQGETSRIKDVVQIAGLNDMELIGYGIVVGLAGSGDRDLTMTQQTMVNLLEQFQVTVSQDDMEGKNVAAVMVTARISSFHHAGDRVDVNVHSIGDASSLFGGTLLMTPLLAPDGRVYALAQGSLAVGGFSAGMDMPGGQQVTRNAPTSARVPGGASLRYDDERPLAQDGLITLSLRHPDFTTASRVATALNEVWPGVAGTRDSATVRVQVPDTVMAQGRVADFLAEIESLRVSTDFQSKLLLSERTGTIVMGGNVHIHPAVIAHGNLTVSIKSSLGVSQPSAPFTQGQTVVVEDQESVVDDEEARIMLVPEVVTVQKLADVLNQMGGTPQDLISILQALRRLGAIQVEIETM
jgi:flagellar P-ring protein precursor FlgI